MPTLRILATCLLCLFVSDAAPAQAEMPYRLTVCLRFADDPLFTRLFRTSVERQAHDQLTRRFAGLASVEVLTEHALLDKLGERSVAGMPEDPFEFVQALLPVSAGATPARPAASTLVERFAELGIAGQVFLIDIGRVGELYTLDCRQLHAEMSHVCALRTRTTPDRQWVGKAACLCVTDGFSPVAEIKLTPEADKVSLEFRGAAESPGLLQLLPKDTVLQPFYVVRRADGSTVRVPVPDTVLRMEMTSPSVLARIESNSSAPFKQTGRVVGFEALRVPTLKGHVRLRLVDAKSSLPAHDFTVFASEQGFHALDDSQNFGGGDSQGYVTPDREFSGVAYLKIKGRTGDEVKVPVLITADPTEVTLRLTVDPAARAKADLDRKVRFVTEDIGQLQAMVQNVIQTVNRLNAEKKYEAALAGVVAAVKQLRPLRLTAALTVGELKPQATANSSLATRLTLLEQLNRDLEQRENDLTALREKLEQMIAKLGAQSRADVLIELASQAEIEGNTQDAIDKYRLALEEQSDQPQLRDRLAKLEESWRIKDANHGAARKFVEESWASADLAALPRLIEDMKRQAGVLQGHADTGTVRKLIRLNTEHLNAITGLISQLADRNTEDDRKELEKFEGVARQLAESQQALLTWLEGQLDAAPTAPQPAAPAPAAQP